MSMPGNTEILAHGTREGEDHPNDFSRENGDGRYEEPSDVRAGESGRRRSGIIAQAGVCTPDSIRRSTSLVERQASCRLFGAYRAIRSTPHLPA